MEDRDKIKQLHEFFDNEVNHVIYGSVEAITNVKGRDGFHRFNTDMIDASEYEDIKSSTSSLSSKISMASRGEQISPVFFTILKGHVSMLKRALKSGEEYPENKPLFESLDKTLEIIGNNKEISK